MFGCTGRILEVDLTRRALNEISLKEEIYRDYVGGSGLAARLFLDRFLREPDPFSPENPLLFFTGPLTGTRVPGCATRFSVCSQSPLTGIWGESSCGGNWGNELKLAGFDGVLITGKSFEPVYLWIDCGKCELRDAVALWGKDSYEVVDALKGAHPNAKVVAIGQAGESLVRFACVVNDKSNVAGRSGLGAVMGSKNLKAVVVRGKKKPDFSEPEKLARLTKDLLVKLKDNVAIETLKAYGTDGAMDLGMMTGDVPTKNWQMGVWDQGAERLNGTTMADTILTAKHACLACPVGCKRVVKVDEAPFQMPGGAGPEYETCASFGTMLFIDDIKAIAKINELCNRYGMDTISCGSTIAFAIECFEEGLLKPADTDGMNLQWGDANSVLELLGKIAKRQGFGDRLSQGSRELAHSIGGNAADFLVEVKGLEAPMHDPRAYHGMGLAYATSNRGACHVNSLGMWVEQGYAFYPKIGLGEALDGQSSEGKAELTVKTQDLGSIFNSALICFFAAIPFTEDNIVDLLNFTTGFDYSLESLMDTGERIWMLKRGINNLLGITSKDDRLPSRILTPLEDGGAAGSVPDIDLMIKEFYRLRDFDERGWPSKKKLGSLGLRCLAEKLGI